MLSLVTEMEGQDFRIDMILFRREWVLGAAARMYPDGVKPNVSVNDMSLLLDERLQAALSKE